MEYSKYYVVIRAKTGTRVGHIVVANVDLYSKLKSSGRIRNLQSYQQLLEEKIYRDEGIFISNKDIKAMQASFVEKDPEIQSLARLGKVEFINRLFVPSKKSGSYSLKKEVPSKKLAGIMKVLFEWNYLLSSVGGRLEIEKCRCH